MCTKGGKKGCLIALYCILPWGNKSPRLTLGLSEMILNHAIEFPTTTATLHHWLPVVESGEAWLNKLSQMARKSATFGSQQTFNLSSCFEPHRIDDGKIHQLFQNDEVTFPYIVTGVRNHRDKHTKESKQTRPFP